MSPACAVTRASWCFVAWTVTTLSLGCGGKARIIYADGGPDGDADTDTDADADTDADTDTDSEHCVGQGQTRNVECGFCGRQVQVCAEDGLWRDSGPCGGGGECEPGALEDGECERCGTREHVCTPECTWNAWGACTEPETAECTPGAEEVTEAGCGPGEWQRRRCTVTCAWEAVRACSGDCIGDARDVGTDAEEICIPGGPFIMGTDDPPDGEESSSPAHEVVLRPFFIDRFEVNNVRWRDCYEAGVCDEPTAGELFMYDFEHQRWGVWDMTWDEAKEFCEWSGRRLPTEAEWEKAARGGAPDERRYPWGDAAPTCDNVVLDVCGVNPWIRDVDFYPAGASPFGVERMMDGINEWVSDWYDESYYADSPDENPLGPEDGDEKTIRGQIGWEPTAASYPLLTTRSHYDPNRTTSGVRCARSDDEE